MADDEDPVLAWHEALAAAGIELERFRLLGNADVTPHVIGRIHDKGIRFGPVDHERWSHYIAFLVESVDRRLDRVLFADQKLPSGGSNTLPWLRIDQTLFFTVVLADGSKMLMQNLAMIQIVLRGHFVLAGFDTAGHEDRLRDWWRKTTWLSYPGIDQPG